MKFKTRRRVASILEPIMAISVGGIGGMTACTITEAYCNSCRFGYKAKAALTALSAVAVAPVVLRVVADTTNAIDDWVCSAPDFYDTMITSLKELNEQGTQEETEAE